MAILFYGTVLAQEKPTEIKEVVKEKIITTKDNEQVKEVKMKVISRETGNVKLDLADKNKVNQNRIASTKQVQTMVLVDDDADSDFDWLSKESYFINAGKNYKFTPNESGFDLAFDNNNNEFVITGKAWSTNNAGSYIVNGETFNGIGYFNNNRNFVVEYYDSNLKSLKTVVYKQK